MKKITTVVTLLISTTVGFSQSLHIFHDKEDVTNKTITLAIHQDESVATDLSISNTTDKIINYQVNRTILNPPMNDSCASLYYCSGITCYPPSGDVTWTPKTKPTTIKAHGTMPDGNGTYGVSAHYDLCPSICNDLRVKYRIYDTDANSKDTAYVEIKYTCASGINDLNQAPGFLSEASPNPASSGFALTYQINSSSKAGFVMHNVIGKKVQEIPLMEKEGSLTINTNHLIPGIYFYSLEINNRRVSTKKVIIE